MIADEREWFDFPFASESLKGTLERFSSLNVFVDCGRADIAFVARFETAQLTAADQIEQKCFADTQNLACFSSRVNLGGHARGDGLFWLMSGVCVHACASLERDRLVYGLTATGD